MDTLALPCTDVLSVTRYVNEYSVSTLNVDVPRCNGSELRNTPRCAAQLGNFKNVPAVVEFETSESPAFTQESSF